MSTQAIQAGEAFIQLNINSDELQKGLLNVSSRNDTIRRRKYSAFPSVS
ncbi:MAG: hypothetical protein J6J31_01760 [Thermoguttaceae bacterium]|nr:hypothetical protein [Thermoguttaceae bacterium]